MFRAVVSIRQHPSPEHGDLIIISGPAGRYWPCVYRRNVSRQVGALRSDDTDVNSVDVIAPRKLGKGG